jgi:hypothetical protein
MFIGSKQKVQQVVWITRSKPYSANLREDHAGTPDDTIQRKSSELLSATLSCLPHEITNVPDDSDDLLL